MQDLMQSSRQRLFGVTHMASRPETDVTIGPHQRRPRPPPFRPASVTIAIRLQGDGTAADVEVIWAKKKAIIPYLTEVGECHYDG
jgi:hypothetical protein